MMKNPNRQPVRTKLNSSNFIAISANRKKDQFENASYPEIRQIYVDLILTLKAYGTLPAKQKLPPVPFEITTTGV